MLRHAKSAKKALSLSKDSVFRLFILILSLLGWLSGSFSAGIVMLENAYSQWNLEQESHINIYLDADSDRLKVVTLTEELSTTAHVERAYLLSEDEVSSTLQPYFEEGASFPLPFVIDVTVGERLDRQYFDTKVNKYFENASIDDARGLLSQVSYSIRFLQWGIMAVAVVLLIVVAVIVSLTVRAGLRGQHESLRTMQHIGATDGFLVSLITRQVWVQSLFGWLGGSALAVATVYAVSHYWPAVGGYISHTVWGTVLVVPLVLCIIAVIASWITSRKMIQKLV